MNSKKEKSGIPTGLDADRVVVDSHLWIEFFSGQQTPRLRTLEGLIRSGAVCLVGPVAYEVLVGPRREAETQYLMGRLRAFPFLPATEAVWMRSVELGRLAGVRARTVPFSDVLIAAHCECHAAELFSFDPHFDVFPDLTRFRP